MTFLLVASAGVTVAVSSPISPTVISRLVFDRETPATGMVGSGSLQDTTNKTKSREKKTFSTVFLISDPPLYFSINRTQMINHKTISHKGIIQNEEMPKNMKDESCLLLCKIRNKARTYYISYFDNFFQYYPCRRKLEEM